MQEDIRSHFQRGQKRALDKEPVKSSPEEKLKVVEQPQAMKAKAPKAKAPHAIKAKAPAAKQDPDDRHTERHTEEAKANKNLYSKMNYKLKADPEALDRFKKLDFNGKRQWLDKFKLDPSMAWLEAEQETSVGAEERNSQRVDPLTLEQLAGPNYLNSEVHAKAVFAAMPKRLSEIKALADIGVEVIEWKRSWKTVSDWQRDQAKIRATGQLEQDAYKEAQDMMLKPTKAVAKTKASPKELTAEDKEKKDMIKLNQKTLVASQQCVTKFGKLTDECHMKAIYDKVASRPWGQEAKCHIETKVMAIKETMGELQTLWCEGVLQQKMNPEGLCGREAMNEKMKDLEFQWMQLDNSYLADIKAMK